MDPSRTLADPFLGFVEHARSVLWSTDLDSDGEEGSVGRPEGPPWRWIVSQILRTCLAYPSGVTSAILLSDLSQVWSEQSRHGSSKRKVECMVSSKKRDQRRKLPNTVSIDSIYEKNFLPQTSILEVVILDSFVLPGTNIYMLNLGDIWSSCTIDLYLHRRYYDLVNLDHGILRKGREIFLSGCCLHSPMEGQGHPRLLPTEYLLILLDEDQDDDAMLLAAQFCSDTFSSISLDAFTNGTSYSLYARIDCIGPVEVHGSCGSLQRQQITLVDEDDKKIKFLLWGEQVLLAKFLSVGSMIAVDKPFIASAAESNIEAGDEFCLEYGSATHLYLVPFVRQEESVLLASTQIRYQGSKLSSNGTNETQCPKVTQVSLPLDYRGSIDFKNYPFQPYVTDLHDKMTGICLYGVVTSIFQEIKVDKTVYCLIIKDITGAIVIKLTFVRSWSLGRVGPGHTIFISGLTCSLTPEKQLEASWYEKDDGASLVNISCLPALPNSTCLHKLTNLTHLSTETSATHICTVRLDQIEHHFVNSRLLHSVCGQIVNDKSDGALECSLCSSVCNEEVIHGFCLQAMLADDYEGPKASAWCSGSTASEMLQICPDDFFQLPEDEQAMYLCTLANERFVVVLVNHNAGELNYESEAVWEIVQARRCE